MGYRIEIAFLIILALTVSGCRDANRPVDAAVRDRILLVGNGADPRTLDPQLNVGEGEGKIISALGEGLVAQDSREPDGVLPGIAKSWSHDKDFRVWTFRLRSNAKWSDGSPLNAKDILYSWRRILTPSFGSPLAELYYPIEGTEAFNKAETSDFASVGIKAPDPHTIVITGNAPMPYLLNMLATYAFIPVQKAAIEAGGQLDDRGNYWFEPGSHVGNGPFILAAWKANQYVEVRKNPNYWDADNVKLEGIRFLTIENQKTEMNAFNSGAIHITSSVPPEYAMRLKQTHPETVRTDRQPTSSFYAINTNDGALADKRVREALSLAIDRTAIVRYVVRGGQIPIGGMVPSGISGYPPFAALKPDAVKARRLLADAGFPCGDGFPAYEILIDNSEIKRKEAEAVQAMWKSVLGIDIGIRSQEWKGYLGSLQAGDFQIARLNMTGAYPGPGAYLPFLTTDNSNNFGHWQNARYDRLVKAALASGTEANRNQLFRRAEMIIIDDLPIIPLYSNVRTSLVDARVEGLGRDGAQNYKFVSFRVQ